jgi:hypothetical protein
LRHGVLLICPNPSDPRCPAAFVDLVPIRLMSQSNTGSD